MIQNVRKGYACLFIFLIAATISFNACEKKDDKSNLLFLGLGLFASGGAPVETLTAPQNVTASDGTYTDRVAITWDAVSGAEHYHVFRSPSAGGTYTKIADDVASASYDDTTITANTSYYYAISANIAGIESDQSSYDRGYTGTVSTLSAPQNVSATDGSFNNKITVTWNSVTGAAHYHVLRSTSASGAYAIIGDNVTASFYDDTTAVPGTTYYYKVAAVSSGDVEGDQSGSNSGYANAKPDKPTGVSASQGTYASKVTVSWNAVSGVNGYRVYRTADPSTPYTLISSDITPVTYDDTTGTVGTHYYYKVASVKSGIESDLSDASEGWSLTETILPAPENVAASQGTSTTKVTITWDSVSGASYYWVYRSDTSNGTYVKISGDEAATAYDDSTVTVNVHYFYKVKAATATKQSELSSSAEGYAQTLAPLATPVNVAATDKTSNTKITVSWDAVSGATYYRVYRSLSSTGDYAQVGGTITATSYDDTDIFEDTVYYYKVKAYNAVPNESSLSSYAQGRRELTPLEYLLRFTLNWEYMMTNLINNTAFPPTFVGTFNYDINGATSGATNVNLVANFSTATTKFFHSSYYDFGMSIEDNDATAGTATETTSTNLSGTGTHTGTVKTSGNYIGTIVENLNVTGKVRSGGTFTVTYGGTTQTINFSSTWGPGIKISTPYHVTATQGTQASKVVVSWAPVYGANKYRVFRSATSGGTYSQVGSDVSGQPYAPAGTVYTYQDSTGNTTHYFYKVQAVNDYMINDQNGDQTHQTGETVLSAQSSFAEGWGQ